MKRLRSQFRQRHQHARLATPVLPNDQIKMRVERPQLRLLEASEILERQRLDIEPVIIRHGGASPKSKSVRPVSRPNALQTITES
jgi:hypothetical protein